MGDSTESWAFRSLTPFFESLLVSLLLRRRRYTMPKKSKEGEKKATHVYIKDPEYAWIPAIVEDTKADKATVSIPQYKDEQAIMQDGGRGSRKSVEDTVDLKEYPHKVLPLANVDANGNLLEFADMVQLPYLHEVSSDCSLRSLFHNQVTADSLSFPIGCYPLQSQEASYQWQPLHSYG